MDGPDNAYSKKNENRTNGGSKEINDKIKAITNRVRCGTLCLMFISLKL